MRQDVMPLTLCIKHFDKEVEHEECAYPSLQAHEARHVIEYLTPECINGDAHNEENRQRQHGQMEEQLNAAAGT